MKNKKGVSPLLGAVLLIAFSIVLAAIVSNFVIKKTKEFKPDVIAEESVYCDSVALGYKLTENYGLDNSIGGATLINGIKLVNKGTFFIHQILINSPGLQPIQIKLNNPIKPQVEYSDMKLQIGTGPEVKIIPIIKDSDTGDLVKCTNKQLIINLLGLSGGNAETLQEYVNTDILKLGNGTVVNATDDEDNDGLNNIKEVFLGTNPLTSNRIEKNLPPDANSNGIMDIVEIGVFNAVKENTRPTGGNAVKENTRPTGGV